MSTAAERFHQEIEAFLAANRMEPTTFGKRAMNDPKFVFDLREGRKPSLDTVDRVRAFMDVEIDSGQVTKLGAVGSSVEKLSGLEGRKVAALSPSRGGAAIDHEEPTQALAESASANRRQTKPLAHRGKQ